MADQLTLALTDRHAGQQANLAASTTGHRDHRDVVELAVTVCARNGRPFTADDVHRLVARELSAPYDHNLVSSVMGVWAHAGRIVEEPLRATASRQRSRRASRNRWWSGVRGGTADPPSPRAPHQ
ncbi:hypothetical protein [Kibdelosporangium phytohabitans]|uniref:Uncharacterized protein n=1 Tax=Kibdelosporangium phytohabitans TaxID=860235 RepID=A0A0N9HWZ5_9PSEU|nr:hypothetical protein [Kibdelosporangium phytohabitans]ALG07635.1 hypothetical protein AOZ06_12610 [Kibdelosporangium phytohabitans]ALG07691.1 hypothetical protein AOZ06_12930 [Kibdelosporangium phytohabitans]MBE1471411.1 hypothetical protein [Kibdelosporangium phytohabitans]